MAEQFKLGLNIDKVVLKPPHELAPGWEAAEIPVTELLLPYDSETAWQQSLARIRSWNQPPFTAASHWLNTERITGDKAADFAELERQAAQTCRRLSQVAKGMVAGVWGSFFAVPEGFSRSKAMDQALAYCNMVAKYASVKPFTNPSNLSRHAWDALKRDIRWQAERCQKCANRAIRPSPTSAGKPAKPPPTQSAQEWLKWLK